MIYTEVQIIHAGNFDPDILVAFFAELGFESFSESEDTLNAYCRTDLYLEEATRELIARLQKEHGLICSISTIQPENWNALWEKSFEPVLITDECLVRAPFHQPVSGVQYDIIVEPKMSFGTAHHETTFMMLSLLLKEDVENQSVLDMGCGTGVLAILAAMKGAERIIAIDNDQWAWENTMENCERNGQAQILALLGDAGSIPDEKFDLIMANINRNVLMEDIPGYCNYLEKAGRLLLSGFYEEDIEAILRVASECGLTLSGYTVKNNWVGARYIK
jgi:ribosomal protein L11 methyltransferase